MISSLYQTTLFGCCSKTTRALRIAALLFMIGLGQLSATTILVPTDQPTLNAAIAAASPGDVILLENDIAEGLVTINKAVTLDGGGFTLSSSSPTWGINVGVAGVSIQNLTVSGAGTFGIITSCGADNLTVANTVVTNCGGSGFALNGSDNLNLTDITSTNNVGNGVSITDCNNVTITGLTTSGNAFGGGFSAGVGIFSSGTSCPPAGTTNVTITGTVSIGEPIPVYEQVTAGSISGVSLPASVATHFAGVALVSKIYMPNLADAYTAAASLIAPPSSVPSALVHVEEISSGNKHVNDLIAPAPPQMGTYTLSIVAAIEYATAGVTVFVEEGTYNVTSTITVNKALTISGPQADVDPRTTAGSRTPGSASEAVVNGGGTVGTIFNITAAGVILNGLEVTNGTGDLIASPAGAPVKTDVTVKYCIVHASSGDEGVQLRNVAGGGVEYCYIYNTAGDGINMCCGSTNSFVRYNEVTDSDSGDGVIYLYNNGPGMQVTHNTLYDNGGNDGIKIGIKSGGDAALMSGALVSNNIVTDQPQDGISIYTSSVTVVDNEITGSGSSNGALYLAFGISNVTITGNEIHDNSSRGIRLAAAVNAGTVTINQNSIYDNSTAGLENLSAQTANAQFNWWGDSSGPSGAGPGSGNSVSINVLFCPWLDAAPPGGMPVSNTGVVHNIDTDEYFCSIQSAIDDAETLDGHTLAIGAGTYVEDVDATAKDVILAPGASPGCVTIIGNITLDAGDVLAMEVDGTTPCTEHDQFIVKGTVALGGASLSLTISHSFSPADQIILIENDDVDPIGGMFAEGSSITVNGDTYLINYAGGTGNDVVLSSPCGSNCGPTTFTGNATISTQTQLNAFKNGSGCKYTEVTGNLTIDGNGNASTGADAAGSDPITDLCNLSELMIVGGNLIIRDFNVAGNPTSLAELANLQSVGGNLTIGSTNANDNNGSLTGTLSLPSLSAVGGTLTVNQNPNITGIDIPTAFGSGTNAVSVLNNTSVTSILLGVSSTTGNVSINTNGTGVTSISMPNLTMAGGNLDLGNAAAHLTLANLNFPALTSVTGFLEVRRAATGTVSFPVLTQVTGNLIISQNQDLSTISIHGPFTGSTNSVSIENNTGSSTLTSIVLGVLSTVTDLAIQSNGTTLAAVNLDQLTAVGRHLEMNNGATDDVSATANVNLSALTSTGGRFRLVRAANTLSTGNLTAVGADGMLTAANRAYTFQRNAIVDLDATFPALETVGGNLNVNNNTNLNQCCIIPCKLTIGGSTSVTANTGNCATLAIAILNCAPTVSDFTLSESSGTDDDGELCHDGTDITLEATATTSSGVLNFEFFVDADDDNELDMGETVLYDGPDNILTFSEAMLGGTGTFKLSVRVTVGGGCAAYPASNLTVEVHAVPAANNAMLMLCSTDPGGTTADFDLSLADADVTGGAMGVTVSYHATQEDADDNVNPLSSPYNSGDATIYARVENTSAGYCYATAEVMLSVKPTPNAGSITSGERLICENGDPAGFTATAVAGTTYQWQYSQDNGMTWANATGSGGVTSQNYNIPSGGVPDPETTTLYRRQVTSNANGCTNVSNSVTVYVNVFDLGTVTSGTPQTVCVGDPVDPIDMTPPTTISDPGLDVTTTYQWQQSANGTSGWANIPGETGEDFTPTGLTATRYFRRIVTVSVDGSAIPTSPTTVSCSKTPSTWQAVVFVNAINPGTINMGSSANQRTICEGGDAGAFNAPAATVPAGATRTYLWQFRAKGTMDAWMDAPGANDVEDYDAPAGSITFDAEFQRIVYSELNGVTCEAITLNNPTIDINEITDPGEATYTDDPDFNVCAGTTPLPFNGTAAMADGTIAYQWRSSTTTDIPPLSSNVAGGTGQDLATPPNMPAHPGVLHIARRVTSTLNGVACVAFTNVITLETDPLPVNPTVTPSGVQSFCTDAASVDVSYTITIPAGSDAVEWSFDNFATVAGSVTMSGPVTITVPAPTPNPPGFVTTTVRFRTKNDGTECVSSGLNRSVRFYPQATADAGPDEAICHDATHTLNGTIGGGATSGTWSDNVAGGTFSPDNTFANATDYTPPMGYSGTITLTLSTNDPAGPCPAVSDQMTLTVYAPLETSISGATDVCINGDIILTGSTTGGSGTIVDHNWSVIPGTGDATITIGAAMATLTGTVAGTVTVEYTVTDDAGCTVVATGSHNVMVHAAPTLTACPSDLMLNTEVGECSASWSWTHPNVLDIAAVCAPATLEVDYGLGGGFETITPATSAMQTFPAGTTAVSYKMTDGVGNMATCSFEVVVNDNEDPIIITCPVTRDINGCLGDITGPAYSTTPAASTYGEFSDATNQGVASDNCPITVSYQDLATGTCPIVVTRTWTISDGTNAVTCEQTINVIPPLAAFAMTGDISIACGAAPPTGTSLSYTNGETGVCEIAGSAMGSISGSHTECGGSYTESWSYTDGCGRTITASRVITVDPAPVAAFAPTGDISVACGSAPPTGTSLSYTNGETGACEISGSVMGVITGSHNECGGSYTETWTFVDDCMRTISASRTITVDPAPVAAFAMTGDINIACGAAPPTGTSLSYTNGETGVCEIAGSVMGVITGGHDECGGSYTETWTYVDDCLRTISTSRTITVDPAPVAAFAMTGDINISCGAAPPTGTSLSYTNGETGVCEIAGSVTGVITGGHDECGGSYTETWTYVDDCLRTISTSRTITVDPAPVAAFAMTGDINIACGAAPPTGTSLSYTNGETGACEIAGSVTGVITGGHDECGGSYTETWTYVDDCLRTISTSRTITVDPAPVAAFAMTGDINISCGSAPPTGTSLSYTNGETGACEISGSVTGSISGTHDECGGSYTETWTFVDDCLRTISTSRTITVDPAPVAAFAMTGDINIACGAAPPTGTSLSYTNGETGACEISGSVTGSISGTHDECGGSYTETWTFVDDCLRTIAASRTITVDPAPVASFDAVSNITISCENVPPAPTSLGFTNGEAGVCEISGTVLSTITGTYTTCGDQFTETWSYTDDCLRSITTSRTITVVAPSVVTLNCPPDALEVSCQDQDAIEEAYEDWLDSFGFSGGCNSDGSFDSVPDAPSFCGGTVSVTYRVTSDCEDDQTCTRSFTVIAVPGLEVTCPATQTQVLNASCQATLGNYNNLVMVTDDCGEYSVSQSPAPGTLFNGVQAVTVTLTVTDNCGTSSCSFVVNLVDNTPPVAICPSNIVEFVEPDECNKTVVFTLPTPSDNCAGATSVASPASGSVFLVGTTIVTVTATDASMNTSTCSFTVQVIDNLPPAVVCPSAMVRTFNDPGLCSAVINYSGLISASDNCAGVMLTSTTPSGSAFPVGFTVVTVTATDASGNTSTCTFTIGVADNEVPTIVCPTNQEIPANASCSSALGSWSPISVSDNCTPPASIIVTQTPPSSTILIGHNSATLVTLTAQDARGNTSSCTFTVTLKDVTAPTALCKNATVNIGAGGFVVVNPSAVNNGTFDNCGFTLSLSPNTFTCDNLGPNTVTLVATDGAGNTASCTAVVTVLNNSAPTASCKNATIYLDEDGLVTLDPSQVDNGSSDACGPPASLSVLPSQFNCSDITSPKTVTLTVTSSNGSSSTCTASVTVRDTIPPVANCSDVTVMLRPTGSVTVFGASLAGGSTDNCSITSYSPSAKVYTTANIGINYLTITVSDFSGNTATCVSEVTVIPYSSSQGDNEQFGGGRGNDTPFQFDLLVYPNPTQSDVMLAFELPYEQTIMIRLFDLSGRMVLLRDDIGLEGANTMPLRLDGLAPGMYILDFQSADGMKAVKRLLVQE